VRLTGLVKPDNRITFWIDRFHMNLQAFVFWSTDSRVR
jgi:hypothetical protein